MNEPQIPSSNESSDVSVSFFYYIILLLIWLKLSKFVSCLFYIRNVQCNSSRFLAFQMKSLNKFILDYYNKNEYYRITFFSMTLK